jgi:hypothetical protein
MSPFRDTFHHRAPVDNPRGTKVTTTEKTTMTLAIEPPLQNKQATTSKSAPELKPDAILQIAFGFAGAKVLFSAVELELFTHLAPRPMNAESIVTRLELNPRGVRDFLDALVR